MRRPPKGPDLTPKGGTLRTERKKKADKSKGVKSRRDEGECPSGESHFWVQTQEIPDTFKEKYEDYDEAYRDALYPDPICLRCDRCDRHAPSKTYSLFKGWIRPMGAHYGGA